MSLATRISEANTGSRASLVPFRVCGETLGHVRPEMARRLIGFAGVFRRCGSSLLLARELGADSCSVEERSDAVEEVLRCLRDDGTIIGWRGERFAVGAGFDQPALLLVERAALSVLGARGYGVHLNGIVTDADGEHMWVARRARDRATWPGLLDQMVAGGQPAGLSIVDNLVKECAEEAGIDAALAATATAVGTVSYCHDTRNGIAPGTLFVFDLELPPDFEPRPVDGEVECFERLPMQALRRRLEQSACFKTNSALVAIDCLVRRGHVRPDEASYATLVDALHRRVP